MLGLPLIRNTKTVDPTDPDSPEVIQIETAMGAAIEVFEGAQAITVPRAVPARSRRRTTCCCCAPTPTRWRNGTVTCRAAGTAGRPRPEFYKTMASFDARFPDGPPSLREANRLTVRGDWTFGSGVVSRGDVELADTGQAERVADGTRLEGDERGGVRLARGAGRPSPPCSRGTLPGMDADSP